MSDSIVEHNIGGDKRDSDNLKRVYIGNLSWAHTKQSVIELLDGFEVRDIFFPDSKPKFSGGLYHRGYCFVELNSEADAAEVCGRFNGRDDGFGRCIVVKLADPRPVRKKPDFSKKPSRQKFGFNSRREPYRKTRGGGRNYKEKFYQKQNWQNKRNKFRDDE